MQRLTGRYIYHFHGNNLNLLLYSTVSTSTLSSTPTTTDSFANYLVNSLGFSHQQALSASNKLSKYKKVNDFNFDSNANSVVTFFRRYGFDDNFLVKIVSFDPRLLYTKPENKIEPKLKFLQDQGFSVSDITRVVSKNPKILSTGLESAIVPAVQIFKQVLVCKSHVITVLKNFRNRSICGVVDNLMPNIALLTSYGIHIALIQKHLVRQPAPFMQNPEIFKDIVVKVEKKIGIPPNSSMFMYGISILSRFSEENIESKCRMFKSFGWTQSDVETLMVKNVYCFTLSDSSIKKKLDFLMNVLQLKPAEVTSCPGLLTYSLEKRVVPRHNILLILREKGTLKKGPLFITVVSMSELRFLKRFVLRFKEVHQVYAKHTSCSMKMLTGESADNLS